MKKKIGGILVMVLLLSTIPMIQITAEEDNDNFRSEKNVDNGNYLGHITFFHTPYIYLKIPYFSTHFDKAQITQFEFDEINGEVIMDFYLTGSHYKNSVPGWMTSRYSTMFVWISDTSHQPFDIDYFYEKVIIECDSFSEDYFQINLTDQIVPLETNGEEKILTFLIKASAGIGDYKLLGSWIFAHPVDIFAIKIIPITNQ